MIAELVMAAAISPCMILRENLYRHYADRPAWIMERVAECVMNHQRIKINVLTDADEIKEFRENVYIAPGGIVDGSGPQNRE